MKLLEVRAQNFGVFSQRRFAFGDSGFALVHGPNEAGKSTLLQLLRELLFGFPHSSPFAFAGAGQMAAEAEAVLQDGRRLNFKRRKGRSQTIEGTVDGSTAALDHDRLMQLLGQPSASFYQNVFAFSLTELAAGADSFKNAGLTLTDALFGGVHGLANLPKIKRSLHEEHESLFKPAAKKLPINDLTRIIKEHKKRLKDAVVKPQSYLEREDELKRVQADIVTQQETRRSLAAKLAHLERLDKAWAYWRSRQDALREMATLNVPAALRPGDAERFENLQATLEDLQAQLDELQSSHHTAVDQRQALACAPQFLERAAEIKALEQEIGKIEGFLRDLPVRQKELTEAEARVAAGLHNLHPEWTSERLAKLKLSLDHRVQVEELAERWQRLTSAAEARQSEIELLQEAIARQEKRLATLADDPTVTAIASALTAQADYAAARSEARNNSKREAQLQQELALLRQRLLVTVNANQLDLETLEPPLELMIAEHREALAACEKELATAQERLRAANDAACKTDEELARLEAAGAIPDQGRLLAARQRRDEGWRLVRRHYIEGQDCEKAIADWLQHPLGSLPEEFVQAIRDADTLADERQLLADQVAKKENLLSQRQAQIARQQQAEQAMQQAEQRAREAAERWHAAWQPLGIAPQSPAVMQDWLRMYSEWRKQAQALAAAQLSLQESQQVCTNFEANLRAALADDIQSIDRLLDAARKRVDAAKQLEGQRQELARTHADSCQRLQVLERERANHAAEDQSWRTAWRQLLEQLALPVDWQVSSVTQLLTGIDQAVADERIVTGLRKRIADMTVERDQFDVASQQLAAQLSPEIAALPMLERVRELGRRWQQAQEAQARAQALDHEITRQQKEQTTLQDKIVKTTRQRQELWDAVEARDAEHYRQLAKDAARRDQLLDELRLAERAISVAREHEAEEAFQQALATLDHDVLRAERDKLQAEHQQLQAQIDTLHATSGRLKLELEQLHQEGEALKVQQELESSRGRIVEHVDRWAALILAERLLEQAIERFQRENQDDVLAEARRLIQQLTHGEHVDIRHGIGDEFWLVDRHGIEREPKQLSRGTQEQLYLAFRLAYVRHHCRAHEPLPFVMDDVLVNFDEERATDTIAALSELSREIQIIFLTCHAKTVEMVKEHATACTLIDLETSEAAQV